MSDLLPCPFCGKEAQKYDDDYDGKFYVLCSAYCGGYVMSNESMDDAVKRWNSRAEIPKNTTAMERPLFIPLKTQYFEAFKSGEKTEELRKYGGRWTEDTCRIGRPVTLSRGYGVGDRISGEVWRFKVQHGSLFGTTYQAAINDVFGTLDLEIACISINNLRLV